MSKQQKIIIALIVAIVAVAAVIGVLLLTGGTSSAYTDKMKLADQCVQNGDYDEAIIQYNEAISVKPKKDDAYLRLADVYVKKNEPDKAIEVLNQGREATGDDEVFAAEMEKLHEEQTIAVDEDTKRYGDLMEQFLTAVGNDDITTASELAAEIPPKFEDLPEAEGIPQEVLNVHSEVYGQLYNEGNLAGLDILDDYVYENCILDIDDDGDYEFVLRQGTCEADYMLQIYTVENQAAVLLGEVGAGHSLFSQYPNHNGLIRETGHMGYESISLITIEDGQIIETEISSRELGPDGVYVMVPCCITPMN